MEKKSLNGSCEKGLYQHGMAGKGKMKRRHFRSSKIGGYEAEMPNVRGGGREPALDAGTKKGEGEMERAMTSPGVYGQMPF